MILNQTFLLAVFVVGLVGQVASGAVKQLLIVGVEYASAVVRLRPELVQ